MKNTIVALLYSYVFFVGTAFADDFELPIGANIDFRRWLQVNDTRLILPVKRFRNVVTDTDLKQLASPVFRKLTVLSIPYSEHVTNVSVLSELKDLEHLELDAVAVNDVSPISTLTKLRHLRLSGVQIEDLSALANLSNLEKLNLVNSRVKDISALAKLTNLRWLSLRHTPAKEISSLASLTRLEKLYLDHSKVTDISPLFHLKNLKTVNLSQTEVSYSQMQALKAALPGVWVIGILEKREDAHEDLLQPRSL